MTEYEYVIQGDYGHGQGWEDVSTEETREAAQAQVKIYRESEPQYVHRMIKRKVSE